MNNHKNIYLLDIWLNIIILFYKLHLINSLGFFPLKGAKEELSLNNTLLIFSINGAVDSSFNNDLNFLIESDFYKDNELLSNKRYINCIIQKSPNAVFGTQIDAICEIDLLIEPTCNTILFSKFISDSNIIKIDDPNNFILGKNISFSKNINITQNFEYNVEGLKFISCSKDNNYTFGIIGEMDKIFVSSFIFNLTINPYSSIKAQCKSPNIYFTKKAMINCTINILNNDNNFINNLNKGIEINNNYYRVINDEGEKILKIKIANDQNKIELPYLNCEKENTNINTSNNFSENENEIKSEDIINIENKNTSINESDLTINENNNIISEENNTENNITTFLNKSLGKEDENNTENNYDKKKTEIFDDKDNNEEDNNTLSNIEMDKNITKDNITNIKNDEKENNSTNQYNTTENKTEDYNMQNISKEFNNLTDYNNEINEGKNNSINNTYNETSEIEMKEENNITNEKNESIYFINKNISNEINITKENENQIIINDSIYKNISLENETKLDNITFKNISEMVINNNNSNISYNQENNNTNKTIDNNNENNNKSDVSADDSTQMWRIFGNRNGGNKNMNKTEIEKEEEKERDWERKKEEERKKKKEEEEKEQEERRRRIEREEMMKLIREREEKERKEREEKERIEREQEENKRREYLRERDRNYENNNNQNNQKDNNEQLNNMNNLDIKLIHAHFRFHNGYLHYLFYSLTTIPKGHKIKISLSITKYNNDIGYNKIDDVNVILTTEQEINTNDKNLIIEYKGLLECLDCRKIILNQNKIEGATIYNIPEEPSLRDAISVNKNHFISKFNLKSPLLYIAEEVSNKDCMIHLQGHFFNKNKFFISTFNLILINNGNSNQSNNITISCSLNERSIFACPINEKLNKYKYTLEPLIFDKKENIIIDNSLIIKNNNINSVTCENKQNIKNGNKMKNNEKDAKKKSKKKKIIILSSIFSIVIFLFLILCCCCYDIEPEYTYSSSSSPSSIRSISSSNYFGETSGLINRRW